MSLDGIVAFIYNSRYSFTAVQPPGSLKIRSHYSVHAKNWKSLAYPGE